MRKVAVITGATDGLGKALALLLYKDYDLALCGRDPKKMEALTAQLPGCQLYTACFDMVDDAARKDFCKDVIAQFGRVDVLINNAGANIKKDRAVDVDLQDLRYMFELNCVSHLGMIQGIYPVMSAQKEGLIVNILSSTCLYNNPMLAAYTASKRAMEGISMALLKEVKEENIGVCNVYPGGIDTNFRAVPNHSYLRPNTVAKMILACIENEEGCVHELVIRPQSENNIC